MPIWQIHSFIHEKASYDISWNSPFPVSPDSQYVNLAHKMYLFGVTGYCGFSIKLVRKLSLEIGLEAGFPTGKYKDLFGYENVIPGIGMKANSDQSYWFPQILIDLKYKINKEP